MKIIKHWIVLLLMGVILFTSCEEKVKSSHLGAIPADAMFVISLENEQLRKKGGLDNLKEYKFYQKITEAIGEQKPEVQKFLNDLIADPKSSGVDTKQSYIYGAKRNDGFYGAGVFVMDNLSTFDKNLKKLIKSENSDLEIEDKGDYKLIGSESSSALVWNESLLFILGGDLSDFNYKGLFTLTEDKSILSVDDFQAFIKQSHDIGFWCSYQELMDVVAKESNTPIPAIASDLKGTFIHSYVNFENGEIKLAGKMSPQSKVDEYYKKYPIIKKDFNDKLLGDFPETAYLTFKVAINWSEYLKLITETFSTGSAHAEYAQVLKENPMIKTIFDALGGDVVYSIYGFAQGPMPIPLMGLSFTVKSESDFDNLRGLLPQEMIQKTGDYYTIGSMGMGAYFAYKDNRVFVTDDTEAIKAFIGKGFDKTLKDNELSSNYKKDPCVFYINLDLETYPESIKMMLQTNTPPEVRNYLSLLDPYKDFSYTTNNNGEFAASLKFKDKSQNSLKVLIKSIDDAANK